MIIKIFLALSLASLLAGCLQAVVFSAACNDDWKFEKSCAEHPTPRTEH